MAGKVKKKEIVIQTDQLTKYYGKKCGAVDVSLNVRRGEIYGFLGPNGAGKTTVMMMILGLIPPTSGRTILLKTPQGGSKAEIRQRVGVVQEKPYLYFDLTALEYLKFFADLYDVKKAGKKAIEMIDKMGLLPMAKKRLGTFSRGMQQKIMIARALIHDPDVLLLDEPISGLDPRGIREVWELIRDLKTRGKTVFLSSHQLSETEKICDRVGIMNNGRLVAEDSLENIRLANACNRPVQVIVDKLEEKGISAVSRLPFVESVSFKGNEISAIVTSKDNLMEEIINTLKETRCTVLSYQNKELTLEEAFLKITDNMTSSSL